MGVNNRISKVIAQLRGLGFGLPALASVSITEADVLQTVRTVGVFDTRSAALAGQGTSGRGSVASVSRSTYRVIGGGSASCGT